MNRRVPAIYVEARIRASMDAVWAHTQTPALHERWDLRFSRITYTPRASDRAPQRFTYETRLGLGLVVAGVGESVGERRLGDGSRTSSLTFASDHPLAIIRRGSGYWKYLPVPGGIRFLTWYDYEPRLGGPRPPRRPLVLSTPAGLGHGVELRPTATLARTRA